MLFTWRLIKYRALQQPLSHSVYPIFSPAVIHQQLMQPSLQSPAWYFANLNCWATHGASLPLKCHRTEITVLMGSFPAAAAFTYQLCLTAMRDSEGKKIKKKIKSVFILDEGQLAGDTEWHLLIKFDSQALWLLLLLLLFYYFCYRSS